MCGTGRQQTVTHLQPLSSCCQQPPPCHWRCGSDGAQHISHTWRRSERDPLPGQPAHPAPLQHAHHTCRGSTSLAPGEGLWVGGQAGCVPPVVAGELASQVVGGAGERTCRSTSWLRGARLEQCLACSLAGKCSLGWLPAATAVQSFAF